MGNKLLNVSTTEAHPPLGNALAKLGRVYHSLADLDQAQGISMRYRWRLVRLSGAERALSEGDPAAEDWCP